MDDIYSTEPFSVNSRHSSHYKHQSLGESDGNMTSTTYHDCIHPRPFINSDFVRPSVSPSPAYPENNREAVVHALRKLQDKVRRLELDRSAAEDNLRTLASEASKYRDILQKEHENHDVTQNMVSRQTQELESQLTSAETRCELLEKQLDYMRKMVNSAEKDRKEAVMKTVVTECEHVRDLPSDVRSKLDRISDLEREHLKLTATQTLTETKIRDLEDRLYEERNQRRFMQERAAQLATTAAVERAMARNTDQAPISSSGRHKKTKTKKKKKVVSTKKNNHLNHNHIHSDPMKHYRLNLAEIPFVAGKSTAPSHAVGANVQRVLSLMKSHNLALCSTMYNGDSESASHPSASSSVQSLDTDLADLLLQLQDEFGQLSCEHQELVKQIGDVTDHREREDLEREMNVLVAKMEAKGQQISKIRLHQSKLDDVKKKLKKKPKKPHDYPTRPRSAAEGWGVERESGDHRTRRHAKTSDGISCSRPNSAREVSLNVLKDMKKLQTTLRKDDLSWE